MDSRGRAVLHETFSEVPICYFNPASFSFQKTVTPAYGSSSDKDFNLWAENPRCLPPPLLNSSASGTFSGSGGGIAPSGFGTLSAGGSRVNSSIPILGGPELLSPLDKASSCMENS